MHFGNERTRSTHLDPKLTFCCISYHFDAFGTVCLPYETRCKMFVPRSRVGIFHNKCTRSTPLDPKLTFCCVSYYFVAFGTVWLPYETRCKTGRTSAKVRATKLRRNFLHERTQSTPLDPKLTFWCISYYLGSFGTFWLPYETRCKTGRIIAKVRAVRSRQNYSQRTHPILPIGP